MLNSCAWARHLRPALSFLMIWALAAPAAAACPAPADAAEYLKCAAENDPDLRSARAELDAMKASAKAAGLWQNPQVAGEAVAAPEGQAKFSASWMQALPLTGERGLASKEAQLRVKAAELRLEAMVQARLADWVVDLVRLRQIEEELEVLSQQEGLGQRALDRLAGLAFQTAEQQAAAQTFKWNQKALEIARLQLLSEQAGLRQALSTALGTGPASWGFVVPHREVWPEFPSLSPEKIREIKAQELDAQAWESGLKKAGAAAWPELALGPVLETEPSADGQSYFAGAALELQLPLWDRKQGERGAARAQLDWARQRIDASTRALQGHLNLLRSRYEAAIPALQRNAHTVEDGLSNLKAINNAYLAGRLPVSAALEAFRQYQDAVEQNHNLEREALSSLWQAYAFEGDALGRKP